MPGELEMAAYENYPSNEEIKELMAQKANELFEVCDKEQKGFITKRDMYRLQDELPLSEDALEAVFESLDDDGNGYLTLTEFTEGFGSFIGLPPALDKQESLTSNGSAEHVYENRHLDEDVEDEEGFQQLIETLGAHEVFDDATVIKSLWNRIRRDEPELLSNFEDFLGRVTVEIKRSHTDLTSLEAALKNKSVAHDAEVRKLYDEMEAQIRQEKDRILAEEKSKERQLREELEKELWDKEGQLEVTRKQHDELQEKILNLSIHETETKQENEKLSRDRDELHRLLEQTQRHLEESKDYISKLQQKRREEKRERAMAALHISEGVAMERESLVKQLDMLRDMNKKLRDDKDEVEMRRLGRRPTRQRKTEPSCLHEELTEDNSYDRFSWEGETIEDDKLYRDDSCEDGAAGAAAGGAAAGYDVSDAAAHSSSRKHRKLAKQGSVMGKYFGPTTGLYHGYPSLSDEHLEAEVDDFDLEHAPSRGYHMIGGAGVALTHDLNLTARDLRRHRTRTRDRMSTSMSLDEDVCEEEHGDGEGAANGAAGVATNGHISHRQPPLGATASVDHYDGAATSSMIPERVFKLVMVGDSGVGKSSFIHRFCNNVFKEAFSATIGVDFQVKSLVIDNHCIALQLWDTAGQERFRSITKQYFRKADGVIVMYDVTSETSYTNVRNWMSSVEEGVDDGTVLLLLGNKIDLIENEDSRVVTMKDGSKLADNYGALFYEGSAKSGENVVEAITALGRLLQEKEDREIQKTLQIAAEDDKKKGCCK